MTTITIENGFDFGKTNFKDIFELTKYLSGNIKKLDKKEKLTLEFEKFTKEENESLINKGGKTIDKIFNSLDMQLGK